MATRFAEQGGASALPDLPAILAALPSLPRPVLARITARLIDRLDELDGDTDLEPEEDCDEKSEDEFRPEWLAKRDDPDPLFGIYETLPIYGADQTHGPLNEQEAHRQHMRRLQAA